MHRPFRKKLGYSPDSDEIVPVHAREVEASRVEKSSADSIGIISSRFEEG